MLGLYRKTWKLLDNKKIQTSLIILIITALILTQIYLIIYQEREITVNEVIINTILSLIPGTFVSMMILFMISRKGYFNKISFTRLDVINYNNFIKIFIIFNIIIIPITILLTEYGLLNK